jgi:hypothetical protein
MRFAYVMRPEDMHTVALLVFAKDSRFKRGRDVTTTWLSMAALLCAFLLASSQYDSAHEIVGFLFILIPSAIGIVYFWRSYPRRIAKSTTAFYTSPAIPGMFGSQSLQFDDVGVTIENDAGTGLMKWSAYTQLVVLPDHIILLRGAGLGIAVPRATLTGANFEEVAKYCQQKVQSAAQQPHAARRVV